MSNARLAELTQKLTESTTAVRQAYTSLLLAIVDMLSTDIAHEAGYSRLSMLIADTARITPRHAARLIKHADAIAEVMTPTGHVTPARLPVLRAALLDGVLDIEQVDVILRVMNKIPTSTSSDTVDLAEKHLVDLAREAPVSVVAKHGEALLARIDADGDQPQDAELAEPKNAFRYRRDQAGWMHFTGTIEPESAEELDAMLGALAKPDGPSDERPVVQRLGDAICDVVHHAIDVPELPVRGGEKPHLNATMNYHRPG